MSLGDGCFPRFVPLAATSPHRAVLSAVRYGAARPVRLASGGARPVRLATTVPDGDDAVSYADLPAALARCVSLQLG